MGERVIINGLAENSPGGGGAVLHGLPCKPKLDRQRDASHCWHHLAERGRGRHLLQQQLGTGTERDLQIHVQEHPFISPCASFHIVPRLRGAGGQVFNPDSFYNCPTTPTVTY